MAIPSGKTIVITGASSGIGKELRKLLTEHGNTVINISRHPDKSDDLSYLADMGDRERVSEVFKDIGSRFGKIDILFCNAGYGLSGPVELIPDTEIATINNANFLRAAWCTRAAPPHIPPRCCCLRSAPAQPPLRGDTPRTLGGGRRIRNLRLDLQPAVGTPDRDVIQRRDRVPSDQFAAVRPRGARPLLQQGVRLGQRRGVVRRQYRGGLHGPQDLVRDRGPYGKRTQLVDARLHVC